jgi:ABC-type multidrug transport system ATPase subunit
MHSLVQTTVLGTFSSCFFYRMTLVLGAPGSEKTTFLRTLAGRVDSSLKVSRIVTRSLNLEKSANRLKRSFCDDYQ